MTFSRDNDYRQVVRRNTSRASALPHQDRAFIALQRTADRLAQQAEQVLRGHGLSGAQYNVLRILRGAEPEGLPCGSIAERMISHDPDITRLLDRLEKSTLIMRARQSNDRRVVKARITARGLQLLKRLDSPIRVLHQRQFAHMSGRRVKALLVLLDKICALSDEQTLAGRGKVSGHM